MTHADSEVTFRPYRPGDEVGINEGFNEVFGLTRSLEEWRWKFPDEPEGRYIMLAVDAGGAIQAHYGAVATRARFGSDTVRAGQIVDAFSRSAVRGTRVFSKCYERFVEACCNPANLSLGFGFPGRRHYEMGLKALRYVPIATVPYWRRGVARRLPFGSWGWDVVEGFDAQALDDLWSRAGARHDVAIVRDAAWLGRRYRGRPGVEYVHLSARRRGVAHAWAVARAMGDTLRWAELVWDGEDTGSLAALDRALDRVARRRGCAQLALWLGGDAAAAGALQERGWAGEPCPDDLLLVARSFDPVVDLDRMTQRLYFTMGDSDLV